MKNKGGKLPKGQKTMITDKRYHPTSWKMESRRGSGKTDLVKRSHRSLTAFQWWKSEKDAPRFFVYKSHLAVLSVLTLVQQSGAMKTAVNTECCISNKFPGDVGRGYGSLGTDHMVSSEALEQTMPQMFMNCQHQIHVEVGEQKGWSKICIRNRQTS